MSQKKKNYTEEKLAQNCKYVDKNTKYHKNEQQKVNFDNMF